VRICPKSGLSVSAAGPGLMLGVNTGAIEINYRLGQTVTDIFVTPDFNVRLAGPAAYHFALGLNSKGDTCIKPLPGNGAAIVFSELMGADTYGVAANEGAVFMGGKLAGHTPLTTECGCPETATTMRAAADPSPSTDPVDDSSPGRTLGITSDGGARPGPEKPLQLSTPFVFSAASGARPTAVARIEFSSLPNVFFLQEEAVPVVLVERAAEVSAREEPASRPAQRSKTEKKGLLGRIKGLFGSVFHR